MRYGFEKGGVEGVDAHGAGEAGHVTLQKTGERAFKDVQES